MRKINPNDIKLFEEWKETDDYLIQSWFRDKGKEIAEWFESNDLTGFEFDDYQWSANEIYDIYNGHLEFHEENTEYKLEIVIELDKAVGGVVSELTIILSNFDMEEQKLLNKLRKDINGEELTVNTLISMIGELKGMK